jgi:hypothetical protein
VLEKIATLTEIGSRLATKEIDGEMMMFDGKSALAVWRVK